MHNEEIIAYNISSKPNLKQVYDMLDKDFTRFDNLERLILHSDQGSQNQHYGYRKRLEERRIIQNTPRKKDCLGNTMAENVFDIIKSELLHTEKFESTKDSIMAS